MIFHKDTKNIAIEECYFSKNYFHFLLDTLFPSFCKFVSIKGNEHTIFFVKYKSENNLNENSIKNIQFRKKMFEILFPNCKIEYTKKINFAKFKNFTKNRMDLFFNKYMKAFRSKIINNLKISCNQKEKIIFIGRKEDQNIGNEYGKRILENQNELFEYCKEISDSEMVYFDNMSWEEQIKKSNEAKIMIGSHGAGLTNSIFMQKKSIVLEILPENFTYNRFKNINKICENKYYSIQSKSVSILNHKVHGNQILNLKIFKECLNKILS